MKLLNVKNAAIVFACITAGCMVFAVYFLMVGHNSVSLETLLCVISAAAALFSSIIAGGLYIFYGVKSGAPGFGS